MSTTYDVRVQRVVEEDATLYDLAIVVRHHGLETSFVIQDSDSLIEAAANGTTRDGFHWSVGNGDFSFTVDRECQLVTWICAKYGCGNAGSLATQTPLDPSFDEMMTKIAALELQR